MAFAGENFGVGENVTAKGSDTSMKSEHFDFVITSELYPSCRVHYVVFARFVFSLYQKVGGSSPSERATQFRI